MPPRKTWIAGLLGVALVSPTLRAQTAILPAQFEAPPPVPGGALAAAGPAVGAPAAAAPAAAPRTIFSFFGITPQNCAAFRMRLCQSQLGQLLNNGLGPVSVLSGGIIPQFCPTVPTAAEMAAIAQRSGPNGAETVAAKIKADEADAAARVAAIEYLGTVDCRHWKEAKLAIINALRADRNECVRFAAARVLNSGCCCSKETIEALRITVSGETTDGFPAELSPRVKAAAFSALQNCLLNFPEVVPPEPAPPPVEREPGTSPPLPIPLTPEPTAGNDLGQTHLAAGHTMTAQIQPTYEERLRRKSSAQVVNDARRTLFLVSQTSRPPAIMPTGKRSVYHSLIKAKQDISAAAGQPGNGNSTGDPSQGPGAGARNEGGGVVPTSYTPPQSDRGVGSAPTEESLIQAKARDAEIAPSDRRGGLTGVLFKTWNQRHPGM